MGFFSFLAPLFAGLGGGTGIGNLLTGAAGLISANKSAKAQGVDFQKLRDDATAAGFNPLTALMAGGTGGYQRQVAPALASSSFIADALGRVIDTGFNGVKQDDTLAKSVREANAYAERSLAERAKQLPRPFGYALTAPQPFGVWGSDNAGTSRVASGSSDPVAVMVPTVGTDGVVRLGPNPNGADLDTAAYALAADAYYRFTNKPKMTMAPKWGRWSDKLPWSDRDIMPPYPSQDRLPVFSSPYVGSKWLLR
jgi:hypothetical protein